MVILKRLRFLTDLRPIPNSERLEEEEEEEGGWWHIVTDFVTRLMRPKYLLKKSDRYMYVYIYIYKCVCGVNVCVYVCVYVYVLYNYMHYIIFPSSFFCVYI